jgi:tRNA-specific 2-thiouridylase
VLYRPDSVGDAVLGSGTITATARTAPAGAPR